MNLIKNGSFERAAKGFSTPTGNGEALADGSKAIAGWTVFGGPAGDGVAWLTNGDTYGVSTRFGSDFLDLTGYHDNKPYFGVEQTIKTVVGVTYDLTFRLGVDNGSALYSGPIGVVAAAGSTSQDFTYDPTASGNQWKKFTLVFTATSTSTVVSFQGLSGDQYIGLDAVAVTAAPAATPPRVVSSAASAGVFAGAMATLEVSHGAVVHVSEPRETLAPVFARPNSAMV
jgi:hypothetical protein